MAYCHSLAAELRHILYDGRPLKVIVDQHDMRGGEKVWSWIKKGIPIRIEIGPRDIANNAFGIARRDRPHKEIELRSRGGLVATITEVLDSIQNSLYTRAEKLRDQHTHRIDTKDAFYDFFTPKDKEHPEIHGGFALSHWCGDASVEEQIKKDLGVTIRCIPMDLAPEEGKCVITGRKSLGRVIYAKAY